MTTHIYDAGKVLAEVGLEPFLALKTHSRYDVVLVYMRGYTGGEDQDKVLEEYGYGVEDATECIFKVFDVTYDDVARADYTFDFSTTGWRIRGEYFVREERAAAASSVSGST